MRSELLIVIPAFNEEENIRTVVSFIRNKYPQYDYIVVNDKLEECVEEVHFLVAAARRAPVRRSELIREIRAELNHFAKGVQ